MRQVIDELTKQVQDENASATSKAHGNIDNGYATQLAAVLVELIICALVIVYMPGAVSIR